MKNKVLIGIVLVSLISAITLSGCTPDINGIGSDKSGSELKVELDSGDEGIWVTGQGKTMVAPDVAILRVGIEVQEATVAEAQLEAVEAMNNVMEALVSSGMEEKDIQTQYFKIRQVTRYDEINKESVVVGYRVTNTVNAKIRDIDETGAVVDSVAAAGGDYTRIDSIDFSIDNPSDYYDELRQQAVEDAENKAEQLASLTGVTLGEPIYISEGSQPSIPIYKAGGISYDNAMAIPETPISPGEMEISLSIQVHFAIAPAE